MTGIFSFELIIISLAAYRVTRLITTDVIFNSIRERIWKKSPPEKGRLGYWITCEWCASIPVASLFIVPYTIASVPTVIVASVFAVSAFVGLLYRIG